MSVLSAEFYIGDTINIARSLLGKYLVRRKDGKLLVGRISETEAYIGSTDKACHAYGYHQTPRNTTMFGPPGHAYIYFTYGKYHCLNFVTNPPGEPDAVLLRKLEPICGTENMSYLRFGKPFSQLNAYQRKNFLNGPGKCCQALALDRTWNGEDLTGNDLFLCDSPTDIGLPPIPALNRKITASPRIGIDYAQEAKDFLWRFTLC